MDDQDLLLEFSTGEGFESAARGMLSVLLVIIGKFASLLPQRYRGWIQIHASSALVSGTTQLLLCLAILIYRYLAFAHDRLFGGVTVALKAGERGGETAIMGSGIFVLAEYMIQPLTIVLVYFLFEGLVRGTAALVSGEIVPTLPLATIAWMHGKLEKVRAEMALGRRVSDEVECVESLDIKLRIKSCRPKTSWDDRITVFYNEELYEVAEEQLGDPPRRFVYLLRFKPANKLVRGTYHYEPDEVLHQKG